MIKRERLEHCLEEVAKVLPPHVAGAPFAFANPIGVLESLAFSEATLEAAQLLDAEAFLSESEYEGERRKGSFSWSDLEAVLSEEPNSQLIPGMLDRKSLRFALLSHELRAFDTHNLQWLKETGDALTRFRADSPLSRRNERVEVLALYEIIESRTPSSAMPVLPERPRDGVLTATGVDLDAIVRPFFTKTLRSFTGLGQRWPMSNRDRGFLCAVSDWIASEHGREVPLELASLAKLLEANTARTGDSIGQAAICLDLLGIPPDQWCGYLRRKALSFRGWAALFSYLQRFASSEFAAPAPRYRLSDFLAVYLTIVVASVGGQLSNPKGWQCAGTRQNDEEAARMTEVLKIFDACQVLGMSAEAVRDLPDDQFDSLRSEVALLSDRERRRLLHFAYEWGLGAKLHARVSSDIATPTEPRKPSLACVIFCGDDKFTRVRQKIESRFSALRVESVASFNAINPAGEGESEPDLEAQIDAVSQLISTIDLESDWPRLVLLAGHPEVSTEESTDWRMQCGVCRGACAVNHAERLARWANNPAVRRSLQVRGHDVPAETVFSAASVRLGPDPSVEVLDPRAIPADYEERVSQVRAMLEGAIGGIAPSKGGLDVVGRWVASFGRILGRSLDGEVTTSGWAGHRGCNLCLIGFSRVPKRIVGESGAFMVSYAAELDPTGERLAAILETVVLACSKINLNYFLARTDIGHFGTGNEQSTDDGELKHADSDLCAGLPWREVADHHPVRLTVILRASPARMMRAIKKGSKCKQLVEHGWVRLSAVRDVN